MASRGDANPEDCSEYGYRNERAARLARDVILPLVTGYDTWVVCGGQDLYFARSGFDRFAGRLRTTGNHVEFLRLESSGHMVLLDADAEKAWSAIFTALGWSAPEKPEPSRG